MLAPYDDGSLYFLIHTGSRNESRHVDALTNQLAEFDRTFDQVMRWAADNRATIQDRIERAFGKTDLVLDLPYNTSEQLGDGNFIIRKGSVRLLPGELSVLPSRMSGDVVLVKGTLKVSEILNSISHGTGRRMARSECKPFADTYGYTSLRKLNLIPSGVETHRSGQMDRSPTAISTSV